MGDTADHPTHVEATHASVDTTAAKARVRSTATHAGGWLTGRRRLLSIVHHNEDQAKEIDKQQSGKRSTRSSGNSSSSSSSSRGLSGTKNQVLHYTAQVQAYREGQYIPDVSV